ncbi:TetR/AcrR family transcriptional regulator [Chromobacterium paludis]|uniref:TetR/AcrR family transcriptional regulator n=1 Tax=Chromobacterium paludis TaxID=2605945 RepID=A0A5C1DHY7_9NEIS|nr:TetR/AcrR family transcriptional regulator [Chromobacterium paludis]QEL55627.1 TetR/AcrR family transcriptional regulator [Chromobacterium paludis]
MRVKTESRRQAIVEGAAEVFLEHGYDATSMAEIAARIGVTKPTLYGYFPSKEELFEMVMKKLAIDLLASSFEHLSPDKDIDLTLQQFGEHFLVCMLQPSLVTLRGIIMTEGRRSGLGLLLYDKGLASQIDRLADFLCSEMDAGRLQKAKPTTAAAHLLGMLESEYQRHLLGAACEQPTREQIAESVRDAVAVFLRGYAPERKRRTKTKTAEQATVEGRG